MVVLTVQLQHYALKFSSACVSDIFIHTAQYLYVHDPGHLIYSLSRSIRVLNYQQTLLSF